MYKLNGRALAALGLAMWLLGTGAWAQEVVRVRGTIERVEGDAYVVNAVDRHSVTLKYKDGEQRIFIPPGTVIVTYLPARVAELAPGAVIFVPAANKQPDGTLQAQRVMVGRDVAPPQ